MNIPAILAAIAAAALLATSAGAAPDRVLRAIADDLIAQGYDRIHIVNRPGQVRVTAQRGVTTTRLRYDAAGRLLNVRKAAPGAGDRDAGDPGPGDPGDPVSPADDRDEPGRQSPLPPGGNDDGAPGSGGPGDGDLVGSDGGGDDGAEGGGAPGGDAGAPGPDGGGDAAAPGGDTDTGGPGDPPPATPPGPVVDDGDPGGTAPPDASPPHPPDRGDVLTRD